MDDGGYNQKLSQCLVADGHCCALAAQKEDPTLSCTPVGSDGEEDPKPPRQNDNCCYTVTPEPPNQKLQVSPSLNHAAYLQPCPDKPAERPGSFPRVFPVSTFLTQPVAFEPRTP